MPGPLTPRDTKHKKRVVELKHRTCTLRRTAMMIRPLERLSPIKRTTKPTRYGTRRSARSPALLTAVRSRRSGLAVHPRRVLHDPAAPDWRGELRVGRTRTLTQRSTKNSDCEPSRLLDHAALGYPSTSLSSQTLAGLPPSPLPAVPDHDGCCGAPRLRFLRTDGAARTPRRRRRRRPRSAARRRHTAAARRCHVAAARLATVVAAVAAPPPSRHRHRRRLRRRHRRRPRRRRSSLLLCRRRSPCHMSLAHRHMSLALSHVARHMSLARQNAEFTQR